MSKIYIIGNADNAKIPSERNDNDIVVMFNIPRIQNIKPDILFVANTSSSTKRFVRSEYYENLEKESVFFMYPYTDEIIKKNTLLKTKIQFIHKLRGWKQNSYKKVSDNSNHEFIQTSLFENVSKRLGLNNQQQIPSTGILAINYFLEKKLSKLFISGFTFEGSYLHNWEEEMKFVKKMIKEGKIEQL